MNRHLANARQRLDRRLKPLGNLTPPAKGWVRAIRDAIGMSGAQLGKRLGITPQSVSNIEESERQGTIKIETLRHVAQVLDCTLVYALVPNSSFEETVQRRALQIARQDLARVNHTMALENQALSEEQRVEQEASYIQEHLKERDLWRLP
jgi:predicted DNA-binding mobile mystery protein A